MWKGIFPLTLVVMMSFAVFWVDRGERSSRLSVSVTSMLTLIAYRFLLGNMLPRLSYLTRMDWFTLCCTALVFLALMEVVSVAFLMQKGREAAAGRVDDHARLVFPLAYVATFAGSFLV